MRTLDVSVIKAEVKARLAELGCTIDPEAETAVCRAMEAETSEIALDVLSTLRENYSIARKKHIPLCQDTGTVVMFAEIGEEVAFTGGSLIDTLQEAVREVWKEQYYRASIVADPVFHRVNTKNNTPAVIHTEFVKGDKLTLQLALKGGGAENMSALKMLKPSDGAEGIKSFVLETVIQAGGNPCPPIIVGIGVGGNFETCALMAKKALFRKLGEPHPDKQWADLEKELLQAINKTGIGAQGLGGKTTALAVHIETAPCHIASLPVAVNLQCHAHRHTTIVI